MHVLAEGKMRCLFSMVFGASMILLPSRAEVRASGTASADIYYRRSIWLMLFRPRAAAKSVDHRRLHRSTSKALSAGKCLRQFYAS
jgi:hypothetical protein